ncbi:MAG: radical SAM protein [Desulfobacterales bacterium]|jgi:7-carboxy-7-deazaguanine synthase|nr:radical SAM protein [Desulfobacterales bacterium]
MGLQVSEIFYSIQGESLHAGRPCVFVRLSGCNLRCTYCDSTYAYDEGREFSIPDIIESVRLFSCHLVEITGGEPLLQPETTTLIKALLNEGFSVLLETNGSFDIGKTDSRCVRIIDIKCPSSGESQSICYKNFERITTQDQFKFVIADRADFDFAVKTAGLIPETIPRDHLLFSPVYGKLSPNLLAEWILAAHLPVRLHLQLHKIIWPDIERGV